jgi:hypothetical protein
LTTPTARRPLCFPDPVPNRANLYDRVPALIEVLDSLRHRTTVVLGGRLIGKTSLLNVLAQSAEEHGEFAMIRLGPADSRVAFMAEILDGIYQWVGRHRRNHSRMPAPEQRVTTVAQFRHRIDILAQRVTGVVFLLCVDEFDSLIENWDNHEARLVLELIEHLDSMPELPVRFLLTMSTIPDLVLHSFRSPILNQSKIVTLKAWDADESASFIEWLVGDWFIFDEAALAALFAAAGGHPYFTKAVLDTLLKELPYTPGSRYVSSARVAAAVQRVVRSREVDLALTNLADAHLSADAAAILDRAGDRSRGVSGRNLSDLPSAGKVLSSLQADGLLRQQGDRYLLRLGLWREWRTATLGFSVRPPLMRRIGLASKRVGLRRATSYMLAGAVTCSLGALLFTGAYLTPERSIVVRPCRGSTAGLTVSVTYPAFASFGERQQIDVTVANNGPTDVAGSALLRFSTGQARQDSANWTAFSGLRPGEEAPFDVDFTTTAPPGWMASSRSHVGVELGVNASGACRVQHWAISVAPIPHLQLIQKVAQTALVVFLIPLVLQLIAQRLFPDVDSSRANTGTKKGS